MTKADLIPLLPYLVLAAMSVVAMLTIALYRHHGLTAYITILSFSAALILTVLLFFFPKLHGSITPLLTIDRFALFCRPHLAASLIITLLSFSYLEIRGGHREEFYVLLLIATLGASLLAASTHFASLFLCVETLTVSLYGLTAYLRDSERGIEAGVKYLILAAVSSAFVLFGMALVYAATGSLTFGSGAARLAMKTDPLLMTSGFALLIAGIGFKLAVVPFHFWTPDVYEGAPVPVTAFIATVSKGAVFAVLLRLFTAFDLRTYPALLTIVAAVAVASMFTGTLLALFQTNVKRMLAYSSIAHLGYLLRPSRAAVSRCLRRIRPAIIVPRSGPGVVSVSLRQSVTPRLDYRGLAGRRPWLAASSPHASFARGDAVTAGFIGKFYLVASGVDQGLWFAVVSLVVSSVIGLFFYLRIILSFNETPADTEPARRLPFPDSGVLLVLTFLLLWLGTFPGPAIELIRKAMSF
jgi:NADH-quinone oxidoreductase subunit N